ncbi:Imm53 family immunity protein [Acidovorax sp. SUPP2539]|uniref:Imm53 family immunity protein n=1 Tax=Acidovorax sp. SUPP2539 TaxID=2920878 RepID=UPI0023DE27CA|nr:Imm53 family immunity protein [Acidovorax sp. SUPP2539]GKS88323.1 immunity 53 family protein [Acidovorax sp. SUPP2539]
MSSLNAIEIITKWYQIKCNGQWEHEFGIEIKNIDNPGWCIQIKDDDKRTPFTYATESSDQNWVHIKATEYSFSAYGGPINLNEILRQAATWLTKE